MEKRDYKRLPAKTDVNIRKTDDDKSKTGTSKNISGGGILLSANEKYDEGTILDIEVVTSTHTTFSRAFPPLKARVKVVRVDGDQAPYDVAAEFLEVEDRPQ